MSKTEITALVGENWFGVKSELDKRVASFSKEHGELAVEKIEAEDIPANELVQSVGSLPFLAAKKLCILRDLSKNKDATEALEQISKSDVENVEIIIVEGKLDKRGSYYKTLKKLTDFKEYSELDEQGTINWLLGEAKSLGVALDRASAQYLYSRVGGDQNRLANELKKLANYESKITKDTIELLVEPTPQGSIFNLLDAAFAGNKKRTMELYQQLRLQKIEPQAVLYMVGWQMHVVALISAAKDVSLDQVAKDSGINPFVLRKSEVIARNLSRSQIKKILSLLSELDYRLKNTKIDADEAIQYLLIEIMAE